MSNSPLDRERLLQALALAESSFGLTEPNPRVGCVIGLADGTVLGQGATQQAGGPHAEVMALNQARAAGLDVHGATAWVTLEPCAHHGRTPPCCDALIAAGIGRVVAGLEDPFPAVSGAGLARLRASGIQVDKADDDIAADCRAVNVGFFSRIQRGRPWVRMKIAASLDGRTALPNGRSQWITGELARADGHAWRRRASVVMTGLGTVIADDPRLDVRLVPTAFQPLRVVLDSRWRTPVGARLLSTPGRTLVVGVGEPGPAGQALISAGAELLVAPERDGRIDLQALMRELAGRGTNEVHVEAGSVLNGALLQAGLVDEILLYLAPLLLGEGRPLVQLPPLDQVSEGVRLRRVGVHPLGPDLRVRLHAEVTSGYKS
jgi:diaminohydroxyphosphoribosylaminopyrimidine deaminase / 5-amino-6-(5-phosphoribosylamino)uracil reductase